MQLGLLLLLGGGLAAAQRPEPAGYGFSGIHEEAVDDWRAQLAMETDTRLNFQVSGWAHARPRQLRPVLVMSKSTTHALY
jgi:hypothetical protein